VRRHKPAPLHKIPHFAEQRQQVHFLPGLQFHARQYGNARAVGSPQGGHHIVAGVMVGDRHDIDPGGLRMPDDVPGGHFHRRTRRQHRVHMQIRPEPTHHFSAVSN
jgi:hypothetical protein